MNLNEYIFREYDIRGNVSEDFPEEVVVNLGKGFGTFIKRNGGMEIALSGDVRESTPILKDQFKTGILSTGIDVIELGLLPTPLNYFSMYNLEVAGAVQITGSHNPPEFNGFKMSRNKKSVFGKTIQDIKNIIQNQDFDVGIGTEAAYKKTINDYEELILNKIDIDKPVKIVMDCANGASYKAAPKLFKSLNAKMIVIGDRPNGFNINKKCGSTFPEVIKKNVKKHKADLGISFDGDADRIIMCDETGSIIDGDQIIAAIALQWKKKKILKGGVIGTLMTNYGLEKFFKKNKIKFIRANVGDKYVKELMQKFKFNLGGEQSGHIILGKYATTGDGLLVALEAVKALNGEIKASKFFNVFKKTPQILKNIKCKNEKILNDQKVIKAIK